MPSQCALPIDGIRLCLNAIYKIVSSFTAVHFSLSQLGICITHAVHAVLTFVVVDLDPAAIVIFGMRQIFLLCFSMNGALKVVSL